MDVSYPVVIIGAGPAGITAAIQLKRAGITPLLLEKDRLGGLLLNANLVENYPGFPQGISGRHLTALFKRQLDKLDIKVIKREVKRVDRINGRFRILTDQGRFWSRVVIAASGTRPRPAGIKDEAKLNEQGKLYYEIRNLPRIGRQDTVTIIGGGDAVFDYALNLVSRASVINILFRSKKPKCLPLLWQRAKKIPYIKLFPRTKVLSAEEPHPDNKKSLILTTKKGNKIRPLQSDWLLVAVGREPEMTYLTVKPQQGKDIPGLFLAGDIKRGDFRQVGIAVGDGLLAAMKVIKYLGSDDCRDFREGLQ